MTRLSAFSSEDVDVIVRLPYRAGLHISYAEDEGGEEDDAQEGKALEASIRAAARAHEKSAFVQEVAQAVLAAREKWAGWEQGVFTIEPDCKRAVEILNGKISEDDLKAYKSMVIVVARAVAAAYGEFGEDIREEEGFFAKVLHKITGGGETQANHPMNVSAAEDDAIKRIRAALG